MEVFSPNMTLTTTGSFKLELEMPVLPRRCLPMRRYFFAHWQEEDASTNANSTVRRRRYTALIVV